MENKSFLWNVLVFMTALMMSLGFVSCGDSDDNLEDTNIPSNVDPEGTVVVNMRNDGSRKNSSDFLSIPLGEITYEDGNTGRITTEIRINSSNNFEFKSHGEIASVGAVSGLGKINSIPSSGWSSTAAVVPGCGYVIKYDSNSPYWYPNHIVRYARLYVVEYMTSATSSGIIGATVKYQGNWKSADTK